MGVLDISVRRERLGNLGGVQSVMTDDGSVRAAGVVADAMRRSARFGMEAAMEEGRIGQQYGEALSGLGSGVASFVGAADAYIDERDRRNEDSYANKFTAKMLEHNQGDGKDVLGAMNETIKESDKGEWMKGNAEAADRFHKEVLKEMGLKDGDFKDSRMQKWRDSYLVTQNAQWLGKRNAAMKAYADKAAEAKLGNDIEAVTAPIVREGAWKDAAASMERVIERRGWDLKGELAKAFRRKTGLTVMGVGAKQELDEVNKNAVEAGAEGGKLFDDLYDRWDKGLKAESFLPPASFIRDEHGKERNPLREWTDGADMDSFKKAMLKDVKDRKAAWHKGMCEQTQKAFDAGSDAIRAMPAPEEGDDEGQKAYNRSVAEQYARLLAKDPAVTSGNGTEWIKPELLKFAPNKVKVALAAIKGAEYKADRARQRNNGRLFEKTIDLGVPDDLSPSGRRPLSANEKIALSEFLYGNGEIDHAAYAKGVKSAKDKTDPLADQFIAMVAKGLDAKFPTVCKWQKDMMAYAFSNTKEANELSVKGTGVKTKVAWDDTVQGKVVTKYDKTEEWLYKQTADAATLVVQSVIMEGHRNGESDAALLNRAYAEYQKLTQGVDEGVYRLGIERRMADNRANLDRMKAVRAGRPMRWMPNGIELSRRNKAKFGGYRKKEAEGK